MIYIFVHFLFLFIFIFNLDSIQFVVKFYYQFSCLFLNKFGENLFSVRVTYVFFVKKNVIVLILNFFLSLFK